MEQIIKGLGGKKLIHSIKTKSKSKADISILLILCEAKSAYKMAIRCFLSVRQLNKIISAGKCYIRHDSLSERFHLLRGTSTTQIICASVLYSDC